MKYLNERKAESLHES